MYASYTATSFKSGTIPSIRCTSRLRNTANDETGVLPWSSVFQVVWSGRLVVVVVVVGGRLKAAAVGEHGLAKRRRGARILVAELVDDRRQLVHSLRLSLFLGRQRLGRLAQPLILAVAHLTPRRR